LLYGDGAITPAISVLSAVEGLKVDAPGLAPVVVPLTLAILIALFLVQRRGTGFIGGIFGPIMLGWFITIGLLGLHGIILGPEVLAALNPFYALDFSAPVCLLRRARGHVPCRYRRGSVVRRHGAFRSCADPSGVVRNRSAGFVSQAITAFLAAMVAMQWGFNPFLVVVVNGAFLIIDLVFFAANSMKLFEGRWFPIEPISKSFECSSIRQISTSSPTSTTCAGGTPK
jgi:K+ transporter